MTSLFSFESVSCRLHALASAVRNNWYQSSKVLNILGYCLEIISKIAAAFKPHTQHWRSIICWKLYSHHRLAFVRVFSTGILYAKCIAFKVFIYFLYWLQKYFTTGGCNPKKKNKKKIEDNHSLF